MAGPDQYLGSLIPFSWFYRFLPTMRQLQVGSFSIGVRVCYPILIRSIAETTSAART